MKLRWIIPVILGLLLFSCNDDDYPNADIPSVALNKFRALYPEASEVKWTAVGEDYEVDFELAGRENKLLISTTGDVKKHKRETAVAEIPAEVLKILEQEYGKDKIDEAEVVIAGEIRSYQVEIDRLLFDKKVVVDEAGNISGNEKYWD